MTLGLLENYCDIRELVLMSVGTDKGRCWFDTSFGSELWTLRKNGKVTAKTAGTVRQMVLASVQWLKDDGLAQEITCTAEQVGKYRISWCVIVTRPDGTSIKVEDSWDGV